jgi:hypothetical protein
MMTSQQMTDIEVAPDIEVALKQLPTATTLNERKLAFHYAANIWDGQTDVFENGPLLGGITRALAIGMYVNERRRPDARLRTYDWFSLRVGVDLPEGTWRRLVEFGYLTNEQVKAAHAAGTFKPLFEALHSGCDYWPLVQSEVGYLPGHRNDVPKFGESVFYAPAGHKFGLAFVDGCKSWYGTKHWFFEIAPHLAPDTHVLFQDYGTHTCFWLPMLVGLMPDCFQLRANVDHTYAFQILKPVRQEEIESIYPDEPADLGREIYDAVFDTHLEAASKRNDRWQIMVLQVQRAAAYAYIGYKDEARAILDELLMNPEWLQHRHFLESARRAPTYSPEGEILL